MAPQPQGRLGRTDRERALARLADRQHGVVSLGQLKAIGIDRWMLRRRLHSWRLRPIHRGVYAVGSAKLTLPGYWLAAVLAYGDGAVLSHRSAAALWKLRGRHRSRVDVTSRRGRAGRPGIALHECKLDGEDITLVGSIPVTSVARTLFDLGEVVDFRRLGQAWEEADRLGLLEIRAVERVVERGYGRRALKPIRRLLVEARAPVVVRSALEERFAAFCREHGLPPPATNVIVRGHEVDVFWSAERLIVELDGFAYHHHRAAFERDRTRDAALLASGYRVMRVTHRRLETEPASIAHQIRTLLGRS
jgi:Protein of unknown function (DUF559)/Transcriptional regulator, AbiEi antitoxin